MEKAEKRAEMPKGSNSVLDRRTVVNGNANLLSIVKRGHKVLDVGCGSGAITKDIAQLVGASGSVTGIDTSDHLISQAKDNFSAVSNLTFEVADINTYPAVQAFDVVTSARVLQWLSKPAETLLKMKAHIKPGAMLTILDYNHEKVEFSPEIPATMKRLYDAFLRWRSDAGMDNQIADNLKGLFTGMGMTDVSVEDYSEVSVYGKDAFHEDLKLWIKVAEGRGPQLVDDKYITGEERQFAIVDYNRWIEQDAQYMKLYLKAVTGFVGT